MASDGRTSRERNGHFQPTFKRFHAQFNPSFAKQPSILFSLRVCHALWAPGRENNLDTLGTACDHRSIT
jgi:hypothetical protein